MREGRGVDPNLEEDFPSLDVLFCSRAVGTRRHARLTAERLHLLSDRYAGDALAAKRLQAIPLAYRAFARQIGLDPDVDGLPLETLLNERILTGRFRSRGVVADACRVALLELGIPVWALDESVLSGPLRIGAAGGGPDPYRGEPLAVRDDHRDVAALLLGPDDELVPGHNTRSVRLFALRVPGVADALVREALWTASELTGPPA